MAQIISKEYANYLRPKNSTDPIWRTKTNMGQDIIAILEVLYYYIKTSKLSEEEEAEYAGILCEIMNCNNIAELKNLDMEAYLEPFYLFLYRSIK